MACQLLQRGKEERASKRRRGGIVGSKRWAFRDESPAGNSNTIGSDLFRDFLQTCHQRNDKWRLRPLLPAFDYPFVRLDSFPLFSCYLSLSLCCCLPFSLFLDYRQCRCFVVVRVECRTRKSITSLWRDQGEFTRTHGSSNASHEGVHEFLNESVFSSHVEFPSALRTLLSPPSRNQQWIVIFVSLSFSL